MRSPRDRKTNTACSVSCVSLAFNFCICMFKAEGEWVNARELVRVKRGFNGEVFGRQINTCDMKMKRGGSV